jgi:hypothetical protein
MKNNFNPMPLLDLEFAKDVHYVVYARIDDSGVIEFVIDHEDYYISNYYNNKMVWLEETGEWGKSSDHESEIGEGFRVLQDMIDKYNQTLKES